MIPLCERTVIAGKYRLQRELAAGGMGAVWVARHLGLDEDVAVKFMSPSLPEQAEARERFAREARAAARVRGPHVVSVLDHGVDGDVPYIVMELLRGEHLGERLRRMGRLTLGATATIADQVARALTRAHQAGIVHRDLKPANVFLATLDDEEIVKVLDFGIAKQQGPGVADMTHNDVLMGSPQYMSPEQARGARDIDHRADLWSFGAILFRAVTGTPAFEGASAVDVIVRICAGPPPLPSRVSPRFAPELDAFFARALDRDPARRFGSAREMADTFAALSRSVADVMVDEEVEDHEETSETQPLGGTRDEVTTAPPPHAEEGAAPPEAPHPEEGAAPSEQQMSLSPGLRAAGGRGSGSPEAAWRPGRGRIATAPEEPHPIQQGALRSPR